MTCKQRDLVRSQGPVTQVPAHSTPQWAGLSLVSRAVLPPEPTFPDLPRPPPVLWGAAGLGCCGVGVRQDPALWEEA